VILIAPYLAYMREDKEFVRGNVVSARVLAQLFSSCMDGIITIDPHLHRIKRLSDIYRIPAKRLSCTGLFAAYIQKTSKNPVIIGPDSESFQWARVVANQLGCPSFVLKKKRFSSERVEIDFDEDITLRNKSVIIVDDIISTGHTMCEVVKKVKKRGCNNIICLAIHGIFADDAYERLREAGAKKIITTNTIPQKAANIDVSELIAGTIEK